MAEHTLNALAIARAQFGANITFHIIFPTITIALSWFLLLFKVMHNITDNRAWLQAYRFWVKIFALCFALGVVSGITMSFQFGTNWPGFMHKVGNVAGPLLAYEVMTAFFLEASFLGIMLFGARRVNNTLHTLSIAIVAFGTTLSAFWILSLISWMHTPAGHVIKDNVAHVENWIAVILNPSMPVRFSHMLIASGLTASFFIAGISAYRWLRNDKSSDVALSLKTSVYMALAMSLLQIVLGDMHGLNTLKHQPRKIAAMEGLWNTEKGAALRLFALPDSKEKRNKFEIKVPKVTSVILTHSLNGEVKGMNEFEDAPPMLPIFFSFRIMVGIGFLMLGVSMLAAYQIRFHKTISKFTGYSLKAMTFSGLVATIAGWYTTEIGRQPWLVEGILKTKDAVSDVGANMLLSTFISYMCLYVLLLIAFFCTVFYMARSAKANSPVASK